jgi:kynureninase
MTEFASDIECAKKLDASDPLVGYRSQFHIPQTKDGQDCIYFCGNSLGLQPKTTKEAVLQELEDWASMGVEGHFHAKNPWLPYHEFLTKQYAHLVGAKPSEVVAMNTLTANLHFMFTVRQKSATKS